MSASSGSASTTVVHNFRGVLRQVPLLHKPPPSDETRAKLKAKYERDLEERRAKNPESLFKMFVSHSPTAANMNGANPFALSLLGDTLHQFPKDFSHALDRTALRFMAKRMDGLQVKDFRTPADVDRLTDFGLAPKMVQALHHANYTDHPAATPLSLVTRTARRDEENPYMQSVDRHGAVWKFWVGSMNTGLSTHLSLHGTVKEISFRPVIDTHGHIVHNAGTSDAATFIPEFMFRSKNDFLDKDNYRHTLVTDHNEIVRFNAGGVVLSREKRIDRVKGFVSPLFHRGRFAGFLRGDRVMLVKPRTRYNEPKKKLTKK